MLLKRSWKSKSNFPMCCCMPGDDGYELLRKVRAMRTAAGNGVPAVALTALVSEDQRHRAMEAGFHEFVGKPVDRARLISILANVSRKQ